MCIVKPAQLDSKAGTAALDFSVSADAVNAGRQNQSLSLVSLSTLEGRAALQDGLRTI
jgi:hypothetical protein